MTVAELIEELRKYPPDTHVVWYCGRESEAYPATLNEYEMYYNNRNNYYDADALSNAPADWPKLKVIQIS